MIRRILNKLGFGSKRDQLSDKFTTIYEKNLFKGKESISGPGSDLFQTRIIINEIPALLKKYNIKTFIDAPCGDLYWMRNMQLNDINYIGIDIVQELVDQNNSKFKSENKVFECIDIVNEPLPKADLVFCRDCLVHLTNEQALTAIRNFAKSGVKYLLTTTFPTRTENSDLKKMWRPLNLQLAPFLFPQPLELINEGCTENGGVYADKSLGLWKISDLNL